MSSHRSGGHYPSSFLGSPIKEGQVNYTIPKLGSYSGSVRDYKANGYGEWEGTDGSVYKGAWENDKPSGTGCQVLKDGSKYEGTFVNGLKHGKGTKTWLNGNQYSGDWENGKMQGLVGYNSKHRASSNGQTESCTLENGRMANETARELSNSQMGQSTLAISSRTELKAPANSRWRTTWYTWAAS